MAIETSCDETACALFADGRIVGERIYSQWRRHRQFGGVVPELASRDHLRRLLPLVADLLRECRRRPTRIAYTAGPGLAGALLAGATTANALAFAWKIPAAPVNHLAGHLFSPLLSRPDFAFPYMALLASGGHTQLWEVRAADEFRLAGATLDDAAGEAFDKTAVLLGLGYPGGAALEKLAAGGDARRFSLPSPAQKNLNFSFSGLKSAVRRLVSRESPAAFADIAAAFQRAAAEGLAIQSARALRRSGLSRLAAVGGVAQNLEVWRRLQKHCPAADLHRPRPAHCGDNAAMIALAASLRPLPPPRKYANYAFTVDPRARPDEKAA
ncbi:MAG: tRNA (adenosine(37)-N6)-threonylcarbamoyltransferase complex transferase subunit TsaD [Gammaproteobacteria bacterium]